MSFSGGRTLLSVCGHCQTAVVRKGVDVESYGKVAQLVATNSVLKLGLSGRDEEHGSFTLVGHLQLDHGAGTWDEWHLWFADGSMGWLSESQGKLHLFREVRLPPLPRFEEHDPGETVDLGEQGTFVVAEVHSARFVTAEGELPFAVRPGRELNYVDISGPRGAFGTLDYGTGQEAEAAFIGREVRLEQLGFDPSQLPDEAERAVSAQARALSCPHCGGPLELRAPDETQRVGCPYCGSLLDTSTESLKVLEARDSVQVQPMLPLGATGRIKGVPWTVIGHLVRSVTVAGIRYAWQEHLLHEPRRGYRWLAYSKGHWSFIEPVGAGDVSRPGSTVVSHDGRRFKHFQSGNAGVDQVLGEFYWQVAVGDRAVTDDYVCPPYMLSREKTPSEITWSLGTYLEPSEVWSAFSQAGAPPARWGVGANQPWPKKGSLKEVFPLAFVFLLALAAVTCVQQGTATRMRRDFRWTGTPVEEGWHVPPLEVTRQSLVKVKLEASVDNSWCYFEGALVNEASDEAFPFAREVAYYHGRSGGESWSEGARRRSVSFPAMPPGRYSVHVQPQCDPKSRREVPCAITTEAGGARTGHVLLAGAALLAWPLLLAWQAFRFEHDRWAESDHPWSSED